MSNKYGNHEIKKSIVGDTVKMLKIHCKLQKMKSRHIRYTNLEPSLAGGQVAFRVCIAHVSQV